MKTIKTIKIIFTLFLFCFLSQNIVNAQSTSIEIAPYIAPSVENIPVEAHSILLNKLGNIVTQNGVIKGTNSSFILTANTNVLSETLTSTAPQLYVYEFQITYYIGNGVDGNLFSSMSTSLKGIGQSKAKAYIDAFKNISTKNNELSTFITSAKTKIVDYYNSKCNSILSEASKLEKMNRYEEALYLLTSIPDASSCYSKSVAKAEGIYKQYLNFDCKSKLLKAQQIWNADPTSEGAYQTAEILKTINPNASCINEVKTLGNTISKKMKENDAREWNVYYEKEVGLEKDRIQAIKEIGKAYGQGQPKNVTYNTKYWW